jgi:hypothetical protein
LEQTILLENDAGVDEGGPRKKIRKTVGGLAIFA